jgi:hypothetical protein
MLELFFGKDAYITIAQNIGGFGLLPLYHKKYLTICTVDFLLTYVVIFLLFEE